MSNRTSQIRAIHGLFFPSAYVIWVPGDEDFDIVREGSHNIVVGDHHRYTGYASIITGFENWLEADRSGIIGGSLHYLDADDSFVGGN